MELKYVKYDSSMFNYSKVDNTFYAMAWGLITEGQEDGGLDYDFFPSNKNPFYISNSKTGGKRKFEFVKEVSYEDPIIGNYGEYYFESADGIKCNIIIKD
jgi:hypothetical protein